MMRSSSHGTSTACGLLGRLRRDERGNVLALIAGAMFPMLAMTGSAIDLTRLAVVKARLQQACDAGALAGRKMLIDSNATTIDDAAAQHAQKFFSNNMRQGWFQTSAVSFTPTKTTDRQVAGTATATVPMVIMDMFGSGSKTLTATCEARLDVADADIMFVLDTTGSMACLSADSYTTCRDYAGNEGNLRTAADGRYYIVEKSGSRISDLRTAVVSFYDTLVANADPSTKLRFGFVPYSATVNTGYLLPANSLSDSWSYESRRQRSDKYLYETDETYNATSKSNCDAKVGRTPASGYDKRGIQNETSNNDYFYDVRTVKSWASNTCVILSTRYIASFVYERRTLDVSSYKTGNAVINPTIPTTKPGVTQPTNRWNGCIEERGDATNASTFSATSPPLDLDVDSAPTTADRTKWKPMWPEVTYARQWNGEENEKATRTHLARFQYGGPSDLRFYDLAGRLNELPCPKQSARLATMTRPQVSSYVNATDFLPYGVTYHDVGMTWGTRLISPNGMFANDTAAWPGHNPPNRFIVFLTDGTMETDYYAYTSHGIEQFANRVTAAGSDSFPSTTTLTAKHNARFTTACQIAKNKNITVFVIAYAQTMTPDLTACASPNQAYYASNKAGLDAAFAKIAQRVAMLRLSK